MKNINIPSPKSVLTTSCLSGWLVLGACVLTLSACNKNEATPAAAEMAVTETSTGHQEGGLKLSEDEVRRTGLRVATIQPGDLAETLTVTATVRPNQDRIARIAPRVEGRLVSVAASLGQHVRAGQVLATLDSIALGEAQTAWMQAQSTYRMAQADFKRSEALSADEIISQKDFLRAQADFEKASADLRAAEGKLRLLGTAPKHSDKDTASVLPIVAPFSGTIIEKQATQGALAMPGDTLFTVADLSKLWVEANLTEAMLAKVRTGNKASVSVAAYPGEKFQGQVTYIASVLDKETRTVQARIEILNKDGRLKPEMFATAMIETDSISRHALVVPDDAIVLLQGQPTVFVSGHGGFEPRTVEPGQKLGGQTVIKSGLVAGDSVVVAGSYELKARMLKSQIGDAH